MITKSDLFSSIGREKKICDLAEQELKDRCIVFEKKHNLSSDDFYNLFQQGKLGDEEDFFEWKALIDGIKEWKHTKETLKELIK